VNSIDHRLQVPASARQDTRAPVLIPANVPVTSAAQYLAYWKEFCSSCTSPTYLHNQWCVDRDLRRELWVSSLDRDQAHGLKLARETELKRRRP
jgi:hypothetical protein